MGLSNVRIDQALFGYREGHRLLQASRKFTPTTERNLLTLTDMSGSRMVDGFEEYVSGYPVSGEESYAFVKTWYAAEMERPGCVWSHVLIIRNTDLGEVSDLAQLVPLFKRPIDGCLEHYIKPALSPEDNGPAATSDVRIADAEALVVALYHRVEKPVIIPAADARTLEALILAVWSQQWPALRAVFRFCTGSLSNRTLGEQSFDLQVVPDKLVRDLQRNPDAFVFQPIPDAPGGLSESDSWVRAGAADLVAPKHPFRDFLWKYADPCAGQRSLYSKVVELFTYFQHLTASPGSSELSQITQRVAQIFPGATCGVALKHDLYGDVSCSKLDRLFIGEAARLAELAKTSYWSSFSAVRLGLRERALKFWSADPPRGQRFLLDLLDSSTNPLAEEIIAGFVEAMSSLEACQLARERSGLLLALATRNPRLLLSEEFWRCNLPIHTFYSIFDFLKTDTVADLPATAWIPFVIGSGVNGFASPLVERFAPETVQTILDRALTYSGKGDWIPDPAWRSALSRCQRELLSFLDREDYAASSRAMTLIAGLLDPHQKGVTAHGLRPWLRLVKDAPDLVVEFPNADAAAFLLSIGFQHSEADAVGLVTVCFEHVHESARNDTHDPLGYRAWKALEVDIPTLPRTRNWDKCERLRRALVGRFMRNQWPLQEFLQCVSQAATLRSVLYTCRDIRGGEDFICSVAEEALSGSLNASEPQRSVFRECFRRNRRKELRLEL